MSDPITLFFEDALAVTPTPSEPPVLRLVRTDEEPATPKPRRCYICQKRSPVGTEDSPNWCDPCTREQQRRWSALWGGVR